MPYTRRELGKLALTVLPAAALPGASPAFAWQGKPDSKVRGVTIGMNMPYNLGGIRAGVDEIIQACIQLGVSGVELRMQPVELFMGSPQAIAAAGRPPRHA